MDRRGFQKKSLKIESENRKRTSEKNHRVRSLTRGEPGAISAIIYTHPVGSCSRIIRLSSYQTPFFKAFSTSKNTFSI
jgi:hypothetical protein